jgi:tetratricopeptide (TPR) repeat protein
MMHLETGRPDRAEARLRWCIELLERAGKGRGGDASTAHAMLASTLGHAGRLDEAELEIEQARAILAAATDVMYAEDVRLLIEVTRGRLAFRRGRLAESADVFERAVADLRLYMGREEPLFREALDGLLAALVDSGRHAEAEPLAREALELETRLSGPEKRGALRGSARLGQCLYGQGDLHGALEIVERAYSIAERNLEPHDADRLALANMLAGLRWKAGDREGCIPMFREVAQAQAQTLGSDHVATLATRRNLAKALCLSGAIGEAEELYLVIIQSSESALGPLHHATLRARVGLARTQVAGGRFDAAESELHTAWSGFEATPGSPPDAMRETAEIFGELYDAWGRPEDARTWRERAAPPTGSSR